MKIEKEMKKLEEENKKFFNKIAKYYDNDIFKKWYIKILRKVRNNINIKKNSKVLDAGCGTGNLLLLLSKRKDLKLYGIDISKKMLVIARKKLRKNVKLKLQSVEKMKEKNTYNYIFSTEAFHHYSNQNKAMRNFYRALKKNGKLNIIDFDFGIFNWLFHIIEPGNTDMNSKKDFEKLFEENKFKNIKQKKIGLFTVMSVGEK